MAQGTNSIQWRVVLPSVTFSYLIYNKDNYHGSSGYIKTIILPDIQNAPTFFEKTLHLRFDIDFIFNIFSNKTNISPINK
tara:strand:+ start:383 stop:622 length:240 start_codon:yes stop_codon:yes gene_type:complete